MKFIQIVLITAQMIYSGNLKAQIQFGVFADCQYCDCETAGTRYYRNSLVKLEDCIWQFNQNKKLEFVVGMGDLIDRDFDSYDKVNAILGKSKKEVYNVPGNHDYEVEKELLSEVPEKLRLSETYHTISKKGWQFIFLNGNEITFQSADPEIVRHAESMTNRLSSENKPNYHKWNGGISKTQIGWLDEQLQNAEKKLQKVVIFCHYPLLPLEAHSLWNSEEVLEVLEKYTCVKLWMNGHNHAGNYAFQQGIHFVNLKGMVETETNNAFAEVVLHKNSIEIKGFGREEIRKLEIK